MRATRLLVEEMRARRSGRIVNMSTESAFYGDVGSWTTARRKMGVVGFHTRSLARELAPFLINVNAVCPGAIRTRAHDRLPKEVIDKVRTSVPMGSWPSRTTWPGWWRSWPATTRATSPVSRS
jgi:acetoacetyl-CoA reductase/3-oxoacyl-[acyl-carrier protein] reductase